MQAPPDGYTASNLAASDERAFLERLVAEFGVLPEFGPKMAAVFEDLGRRQHDLNLDERVRFEGIMDRVGRVAATWRLPADTRPSR